MPVSFSDIEAAAERIKGKAVQTPALSCLEFNKRFNCQAFFKAENLQHIGAFKFRGAYNAVAQLTDEDKERGVLTFSSGNHGAACAAAGSMLGVPVTVVMPYDAAEVKKENVRRNGGEVVLFERSEISREALGKQIAEERGMVIIPPYDHEHIVAGQGTAGLELFEQSGGLDVFIIGCGGGGLLSGCSVVAKHLNPNCKVIGVEPEGADDACRSFRSGKIETCDNPDTIADGARTPFIGKINFELIQKNVDDMITVSDAELLDAVRTLWEEVKVLAEPTAGLATAAVTSGKVDVAGKKVGLMITGGNADLPSFTKVLYPA